MRIDNNFGRTNFDIRLSALMSAVNCILDKTEARLEKMETEGWDTHPIRKGEYEAVRNLHGCYEEIFNSDPKTESELETAEWLFNGGKLRSSAEIAEWQERMEREAYRKAMERRLLKIRRMGNTRRRMTTSLIVGLVPFVPTLIIVSDFLSEFCTDGLIVIMYYVGCAMCILPAFLIAKISNYSGAIDDEVERSIELRKGGEKYRPDPKNVIDVASYTAILHSTSRRMRRK